MTDSVASKRPAPEPADAACIDVISTARALTLAKNVLWRATDDEELGINCRRLLSLVHGLRAEKRETESNALSVAIIYCVTGMRDQEEYTKLTYQKVDFTKDCPDIFRTCVNSMSETLQGSPANETYEPASRVPSELVDRLKGELTVTLARTFRAQLITYSDRLSACLEIINTILGDLLAGQASTPPVAADEGQQKKKAQQGP